MDYQPRGPHSQVRALYRSLLESPSNFDEFKELLALYPAGAGHHAREADKAVRVRARLNARISEWLGDAFAGLSERQILLWREIVVDQKPPSTLLH